MNNLFGRTDRSSEYFLFFSRILTAGGDGDVRIFKANCFEDDDADSYRLGESVHALAATVSGKGRGIITPTCFVYQFKADCQPIDENV